SVLEQEELFRSSLSPVLAFCFFLYSLTAALHYLFLALESSRQAEAQALEMRLLAREAELQALRLQLDPHFLFNSLNSISALVTRDPAAARVMCQQLADYLRRTVEMGPLRRVELRRELDLTRDYLAVEKVRFGERLSYRFETDPSLEKWQVPPLILQPLVENAVRHGIAHLIEGGEIEVRAVRRSRQMVVSVENPCDPDRPRSLASRPGPGRGEGGVGLENVRRRLKVTWGGLARLETRERDEVFRVELKLPEQRGDA
ncbi:MAG: histidine kinase, partial [Acidobacteriota bacterium]